MSNYPDGMSRKDLWYVGEIPDDYGHWVGEGYGYNSTEYDPELDVDYEGEDEDEEEE